MKKYFFEKEFLISMATVITCLLLIVIFPSEDVFQSLVVGIAFFLIVPFLYVKIILGEPMRNYGIQIGEKSKGFFWMIFSLIFFFVIFFLIYRFAGFLSGYRLPDAIGKSFLVFVGYELFLTGFFLFLYIFFFHGWILNFLRNYFGAGSVLLQFAIFALFLAFADNLNWSFSPYVAINLLGGWIAYKSRSIWYSFVFGWISIILLDAVLLRIL